MSKSPQAANLPSNLFYINQRNNWFADWGFSFWREIIRRSVQANASWISIDVDDDVGLSAYGKPQARDHVVRVRIMDNSKNDNKFLSRLVNVGNPFDVDHHDDDLKNLRLLALLSQDRFMALSGDVAIEGYGAKNLAVSRSAMLLRIQQHIDILQVSLEGAKAQNPFDFEWRERTKRALRARRADLAHYDGGVGNGLKMEIDINPSDYGDDRGTSKAKMMKSLEAFLSIGHVPLDIYVDDALVSVAQKGVVPSCIGDALTPVHLKKPTYVSALENDESRIAQISVYPETGAFAGMVVVVDANNCAVFRNKVDGLDDRQVVVKLDKSIGNNVFSENHEAFIAPWNNALWKNISEIIAKGHGIPVVEPGPDDTVQINDTPESKGDALTTIEDGVKIEHKIINGASGAGLIGGDNDHWFEQIATDDAVVRVLKSVIDDDAFFDGFHDPDVIVRFRAFLKNDDKPDWLAAVSKMEGDFQDFIRRQVVDYERQKNQDIDDIHVAVKTAGSVSKINVSVRQYSPDQWRRKGEENEGRGLQANMLLAAWNLCCKHAVQTLLKTDPDIVAQNTIKYRTGWYFDGVVNDDGKRVASTNIKQNGVHAMLLNPVFADGRAAVSLNTDVRSAIKDGQGRPYSLGVNDLIQLAVLEACHIKSDNHDPAFIDTVTQVSALLDRNELKKEMKNVIEAIKLTYGRNPYTRIQSMVSPPVLDENGNVVKRRRRRSGAFEDTARPAEKLLAIAAPNIAVAAGIVLSENDDRAQAPSALGAAMSEIIKKTDDDAIEIDCQAMLALDRQLKAVNVANKIDLDALTGSLTKLKSSISDAAGIPNYDDEVTDKDLATIQSLVPREEYQEASILCGAAW